MNTSIRARTGGAADPAPAPRPAEIAEAELLARFFRVLGDPTRVRLVQLLLDAPTRECTVGELVVALAAPRAVSRPISGACAGVVWSIRGARASKSITGWRIRGSASC